MRVAPWIGIGLVLSLAFSATAQEEWDNYKFPADGFEVLFPERPHMETTTWVSQYRYVLPAHVYTASLGPEHYTVTVVDYSSVQAQAEDRSKHCPVGAETCIGNQDGRKGAINGLGYWKMDVRGAMMFAALKFLQRDARVADYSKQFVSVVESDFLQMLNPDGSHTFVNIAMHENKLYVFEGTVPKNHAEPALFQTSVGFLDAQGNEIRYTDYYSSAVHGLVDQYPAPPRRVNGKLEPEPTSVAK